MSAVEQDDSLAIRAKPRPVKRFNKRVLIGASSVAALLILGAAAMALRTPDRAQEAHTELYNTRHKPMPDAFASLPESYGDMPSRLGPPLPGDLGAAMIGAPRIEDAPENPFRYQPARVASTGPASRGPSAADDARTSDLFFINNSAQGGRVLAASDGGPPTRLDQLASVISPGVEGRTISTGFADALDPNFQQRKEGFLGAEVDDGIYNPHRLQAPISPYQVMAGTIIPASLVTGLNSDLPGQVIAQVTENVYDTPTGAHLLIPQGSRLIGRYDSVIAYGPHKADDRNKVITIGVIGTKAGLGHFRTWARGALGDVLVPPPKKTDKEHRLHLSNFPGMPAAFGVSYDADDFIEYEVSADRIETTTALENHHEAVAQTVKIFLDRVRHHDDNEERRPDVWMFVLPEIIYARCTRQARRSGVTLSPGEYVKRQKQRSSLPLLEDVLDLTKEDIFDDVPDFHRQAKAKLLKLGYTSQLVRETTLAPDAFTNKHGYPIRGVQDAATIAWNLATGLYYKTQAEPPWKIAGMRDGVCYVGLVFKNLPNDKNDYACCAAQMFLSEGDGIVFRGANGPWQTEDGEFHLKKAAAKDLIGKVLETYEEKFGGPPKELFIHGRAGFSREEWEAFEEAAPVETNIVGVRIKTTTGQVKLFRDGKYPTLRGTAMILDGNNAFLWTSGYAPRLDTYIGPETPNPLNVTVLRSSGERPDLETVLSDILALTKINYNACNYSDGLPVTIRFANKVGDVLVMGSAKGGGKQPFKFYI